MIVNWNLTRSSFEYYSDYYFSENENPKGEMLKIVLSIAGALAVIYGLYVSHRRVRAMEKGVEKQAESIQNQTKQLELTRKSQIDERFSNAVEHLGSDKEPVILGGIAELHQIAKENKEDYAEIVFNILTSYIRSNTDTRNNNIDLINETVVQTIVNYLLKEKSNKDLYDTFKLDLSFCHLAEIDLSNCNLSNSNLKFSVIRNINDSVLVKSNLYGAKFPLAKINNTNLSECNLLKTFFHFAEIKNSNFSHSKASKTLFLRSTILDTNFNNIIFSNVNFSASYFQKNSFLNCEIFNSKFYCTYFSDINFSELELLSECDFRAANFNNVNLDLIMTNSNFRGADVGFSEYTRMYGIRLQERVWKKNNVDINYAKYSNLMFGELTDEDCKEIEDDIGAIEKEMYPNLNLDD